ncbi:MAG: 3-keto-5-aminohexanoate cleavage protein [Hyphomicrobiales bacterium]
MTALPAIVVAPNGARKTHADHPAVPVTIPEIVATAAACFKAGVRHPRPCPRRGRRPCPRCRLSIAS